VSVATVGRAGAVPFVSGVQYPGAVSSYRATAAQFQGAVPVVSWLGDEDDEDTEMFPEETVEEASAEVVKSRGRPKKVADDV
jgi:hypothetical protein